MIALGLVALISALGGQQEKTLEPVQFGRFTLMKLTPDSCQAITSTDLDGMILSFGENDAGKGHLVLVDMGWEGLTNNQYQDATISFDGWKTSAPIRFRTGQMRDGHWMLDIGTDATFAPKLRGAKRFSIRAPGVQLDREFAMPEASELLTELHKCNARLLAL